MTMRDAKPAAKEPTAEPSRQRREQSSGPEQQGFAGGSGLTQRVLTLQRVHGNQYVQRMVARGGIAQRSADPGMKEGGELDPGVESSIQRARGGGQALDAGVRAQMEPALGTDLGGVRVHTGAEADRLNRAVSARAFTTGRDVFFRQGEYNPGSSSGRELLAHELTHVAQQRGAAVQAKLTLGPVDDPAEREADEVAQRVMRRHDAGTVTATPEPRVQRMCAQCESALESGNASGLCPECQEKLARASASTVQTMRVQRRGVGPARDLTPSSEFLQPGWTDVNELGVAFSEGLVEDDGGVILRTSPGGTFIRWLPQNTKFFILKESPDRKFYAVSSLTASGGSGEFGYVAKRLIWRNLPDPDAEVYKIKPGESAIELAAKHYSGKGFDVWGKDKRYVVNALVWVNQRTKHNSGGKSGIYKASVDDDWDTTKTTAGIYIWLPGVDFLNAIYEKVKQEGGGTGSITADLWEKVKTVGKWIAYGLAFVGGLLHGFVKSLWDAVSGLVTTVVDVLVSIFTGSVIKDAKELWDAISKLTWKDIKEAVGAWADKWAEKLNSSSPWVAGHAHGYLTGYVMAEAAQLLLTGGTLAAVKGALWASRLGKFIQGTRAFQGFAKGIEKAGEAGGKVKKAVGAAAHAVAKSKPFTVLADARRWVGNALRLSAQTLEDLSLPAINKLRTLSDDALEALSRFAEPFKRIILGCESPCKVDLDVIQKYLAGRGARAATGVKKLENIDDILAALPAGIDGTLIKKKLKAHPAFVEAIKKAGLTSDDIMVVEKFLTPADLANAATAYRTFTRTMSSLIAAKVGRDIDTLNDIAKVIVALEPRWGAAFKGPMFESFAKLHAGRFRNIKFGRATFDKSRYRSLAKTRTSDGFIESSGALWDFKHTADKVPTDQAEDYFKILTRGMESTEGTKVKSVNFLFATKAGADANAHLIKQGFVVHYMTPPDVITKL